MGAQAFRELAHHADVGEDECVLEVGSERGEGSTKWLSRFCYRRGIIFHTVDVDPDVYREATRIVRGHPKSTAHFGRGEDFLANGLPQRIRFAYLDGFDCIPRGYEHARFVADIAARYALLGMDLTNAKSEASHLSQAVLVEIRAASRCAVMIDDTNLIGAQWVGKGALAMPYLGSRGFELRDVGGAGLAVRCG